MVDWRFVVVLIEKVLPLVTDCCAEVGPVMGHVTCGRVRLKLVVVIDCATKEVPGIKLWSFCIDSIVSLAVGKSIKIVPSAFHYPALASIKVIGF